MAPTAARRARPVQHSGHQGLRGNPDACHPRRGSACDETNNGAPAEAQRSGFGGESFPAKRRQWRIKRAGKKERRDWRASLARESQCRDGSKGTVEGVSFAACGEANDLKLVPTKRAAMRGWFFALSVQPAAAMIPRTGGGPGRAKPPGPSFPPFLREEMPHGAPVCASAQGRGEAPAPQGPRQQAEAGPPAGAAMTYRQKEVEKWRKSNASSAESRP